LYKTPGKEQQRGRHLEWVPQKLIILQVNLYQVFMCIVPQ
jgi:hypothetical protein